VRRTFATPCGELLLSGDPLARGRRDRRGAGQAPPMKAYSSCRAPPARRIHFACSELHGRHSSSLAPTGTGAPRRSRRMVWPASARYIQRCQAQCQALQLFLYTDGLGPWLHGLACGRLTRVTSPLRRAWQLLPVVPGPPGRLSAWCGSSQSSHAGNLLAFSAQF
jgi:hypothetical protein